MDAIHALLNDHTVCTLATADGDGPWAVSLMYAPQVTDTGDLALFWMSDPKTRHSTHLAADPRCAVTIANQYDDFTQIQGLQMIGAAEVVSGDPAKHGMALLQTRFSFLKRFMVGKLAVSLNKTAIYRFRPRTITRIDNRQGFGFKETLVLPPV